MRCSFLLHFFAVSTVWAIPPPGPAPTQYDPDMAIKGVSPRPTSGMELRSPAQLFKRQEDRTCGFINADYENAATCNEDYYCAYNTLNTVFGCCSGALTDCYIETACYPSKAAVASCDSSCLANPYNYICTTGTKTLCHVFVSIYRASTLYNFGCGPRDYTSYVYPTYTTGASMGASSIRSIKPVIVTNPLSTQPASRKSDIPLDQPSTAPLSSQSPSILPAPSGNKTPVGPIIGGVIGGLALIAIAAVAIVLLLRRSKSTPPTPQLVQPVQPVQQYFDPKLNLYGQPYVQQPVMMGGIAAPQQSMSPPHPASPSMSPPLSPAPPYGQYAYIQNPPGMSKGLHEAG